MKPIYHCKKQYKRNIAGLAASQGPLGGVLGPSWGISWKRGELDTSWGPLGPFSDAPFGRVADAAGTLPGHVAA